MRLVGVAKRLPERWFTASPVAFFCMLLCYIDESGTPEPTGNTSHYVLAGLAIPISEWKRCDSEIDKIKKKFHIVGEEIHTAWILRKYLEQSKIPNFDSLDYSVRRYEVERYRKTELLRLQKTGDKGYKQMKKNYDKTSAYIHLSYDERVNLIKEIAEKIASWSNARLFAECIDKLYFDPLRSKLTIDEQGLEQIVSRFQTYLTIYTASSCSKQYGLLIHDNNQTVAKKHTNLMKKFHRDGTFWVNLDNIIETPLFVNSELTCMIQLVDVCSYALRRYLETQEDDLFDIIYTRGDRSTRNGKCVGIRHFTEPGCKCKICTNHS